MLQVFGVVCREVGKLIDSYGVNRRVNMERTAAFAISVFYMVFYRSLFERTSSWQVFFINALLHIAIEVNDD